MAASPLPLSIIVNVAVQVAPQAPVQPTFNQGIVIGNSSIIPSYGGSNPRLRQYATTAAMITDGFTTSSPEYLAAQAYFNQTPTPLFVWVGRQDATSVNTYQIHSGAAGTGYAVGDTVTFVQGGASNATAKVTSIGGGGAVTGLAILTDGTGYAVANALTTTTTGSGTGLQIDVLTIGETPLVALTYCRNASNKWYAAYSTTAVTADHEAIAAYVQSATPNTVYFYTTSDVAALNNTANNVFAFLNANNYNRVIGIYSTTQGGAAPGNTYAGAAFMGVAMGLNTGLVNSAYTLKFKQLTGITVEPLTLSQVNNIEGNKGNVYVNYGSSYSISEQGWVANGQFFDEIINLDMLTSNIQFAIMNLLVSNPKIPQTDAGQTLLIGAVNAQLALSQQIGFIGPGVWNGVQILGLTPGTYLPNGYLVQSPPYRTQTTANRQARQAMPIYANIIEAGAAHSVTIGLYVQR